MKWLKYYSVLHYEFLYSNTYYINQFQNTVIQDNNCKHAQEQILTFNEN